MCFPGEVGKMQGLIRELADLVELANRVAEAFCKDLPGWSLGTRTSDAAPCVLGTYRWEDGGKVA